MPKPGFARRYAFLGVDFGSIDTAFTRNGRKLRMPDGIAHYLEHKMFDLPDGNAMNLFAAHGGSPNAFTSYSMTAYYFDCTENFEENLKILLRMVTTPYFTEESVEKERGIIGQEIRMYEDSAESQVYEDLFRCMFREHPVRVPIAGTVQSVGEITAQSLYDCHAAFYRPANMILCVAGDVDPERVAAIAEELVPPETGALPERDYGAPEQMQCPCPRKERVMEVSMPTFALGFKCPPPEPGFEAMRREIIGDIAAEILTGESSPLYQRLYEAGLIDAGFSAGYESVKEACLLSASGDSLPSCRDTIAADRDLAEHRGECIAHFLKGLLRVEPKEMLLHTSHADNKRHLAGSRIVLHRLHLDIRCVRPECHVNDPLHELRRLLRGHCSVSRQVVACQRDSDSKTDKGLSINSHQITPLSSNRFGILGFKASGDQLSTIIRIR